MPDPRPTPHDPPLAPPLHTADAKTWNWPKNCTGASSLDCPYAQDYASLIEVVRTLGTGGAGSPPDVYLMVPPPLMKNGVYGMQQTVINQVLPAIVPAINGANKVPNAPIDIYTAEGGHETIPAGGCTLKTQGVGGCGNFCDPQSCDQCHPDDVGYHLMARTVAAALQL